MTKSSKPSEARKLWTKPEVRKVVPVEKTFGGTAALNDQDDIYYNAS